MPNFELSAILGMVAAPVTNSGLIVFLPLVGAILGGIVGAVGGAWANSWYRDREAKKVRDQERKALLLLFDAEVFSHIQKLKRAKGLVQQSQEKRIESIPMAAILNEFATPRTEDWDRVKERLAQLLPVEHMNALIVYYKDVKDILTLASHEELTEHGLKCWAELGFPLIDDAIAIREQGKKYLKVLPDYDEPDT